MDDYYVYENWTHKRARIHKGDCSHCNRGRGTHAGSSERNGRWHGPYNRAEAFRLAQRLRQDDTAPCSVCAP
jgi:F-type H+-transporting ATPase subunit beta